MEIRNTNSPEELVNGNSERLIAAIAETFSLAIGDLNVIPDSSSACRSAGNEGRVSCLIWHYSGYYGASFAPNTDGSAKDIRVFDLRKPKKIE